MWQHLPRGLWGTGPRDPEVGHGASRRACAAAQTPDQAKLLYNEGIDVLRRADKRSPG